MERVNVDKFAYDFMDKFAGLCLEKDLTRAEIIESVNEVLDMGAACDRGLRKYGMAKLASAFSTTVEGLQRGGELIGGGLYKAIDHVLTPPRHYVNDTGPYSGLLKPVKDTEKIQLYERERRAIERRIRILKAKKEEEKRLNRSPMNRLFI